MFIGGKSDWGVYQGPGALERMQKVASLGAGARRLERDPGPRELGRRRHRRVPRRALRDAPGPPGRGQPGGRRRAGLRGVFLVALLALKLVSGVIARSVAGGAVGPWTASWAGLRRARGA